MKKVVVVAVLSFSAALALAAALVAATGARNPSKVGLALAGPKNDRSFFQGHYDGLLEAKKKFGLGISVVDNLEDPQAQIDALTNLARDNALVIGGGAALATPMNAVAKQFPDVQFVESAGVTKPAPNVHFVLQNQAPLGYVAGVVAAKLTKAKVVGFVGGALIPPTIEGLAGFKAGVQATDPSIKVRSVIVGTFSDPVKGKQAAAAQIASGADVVFGFLDAGFPGVLEAIKESGKDVKTIGVIFPKCTFGPQVVGDTISRVDSLVFNIVRDFRGHKLTSKAYGLEDATVEQFALCPKYNTPELSKSVADTTQAIVAGKIKVPLK